MSQGRRTKTLPPGWDHTRAAILERDRHTCYLCRSQATEVDHIIPASEGGTDHPSNLAAICTRCHRRKTGREAARAKARRYDRSRPTAPHPGRKT